MAEEKVSTPNLLEIEFSAVSFHVVYINKWLQGVGEHTLTREMGLVKIR